MLLYAYFEDEAEPGRRNPAFDTDIFLHHTPEDLEKLRGWCEEAASERPHLTYVIVDLDHQPDPDETAPKIMHRIGGVRLGRTPLHDEK